MFDYVNKLQLALGDKARRTGLKVGAGVVVLIGAGFLLAALWSWLAWNLELGPAIASLIIGGGLALIGLILWLASGAERHPMPTGSELKSEVETRLSDATDAALEKAKFKAEEALDSAQARVAGLFGAITGTARSAKSKAADGVHSFADKASDLASKASDVASDAAHKVGLDEHTLDDAKESIDRALNSRAAPGIGVAGAFAVGVAIASALKSRRHEEDFYYDDDDLYDEDFYA
ncbi:phage holin family protein [Paracoccus aurantiacus]|uniref:Phage holin family protein n=1 Tax=Paracoccus aurantiacus TaxID=2599412 RepID=A0A5C6S768_9RHOB|nr:phage holin family protein [Paracoccus aurantiacus]TXB70739.1 phage holin family protein [Paracoccus aurantiacus]